MKQIISIIIPNIERTNLMHCSTREKIAIQILYQHKPTLLTTTHEIASHTHIKATQYRTEIILTSFIG